VNILSLINTSDVHTNLKFNELFKFKYSNSINLTWKSQCHRENKILTKGLRCQSIWVNLCSFCQPHPLMSNSRKLLLIVQRCQSRKEFILTRTSFCKVLPKVIIRGHWRRIRKILKMKMLGHIESKKIWKNIFNASFLQLRKNQSPKQNR